ncbi:MAG: O-antigen ligase family protein [Pseudomonadota bacterium]
MTSWIHKKGMVHLKLDCLTMRRAMTLLIAMTPASGMVGRSGLFTGFGLAIIAGFFAFYSDKDRRGIWPIAVNIKDPIILGFVLLLICIVLSAFAAEHPARALIMACRLAALVLVVLLFVQQWSLDVSGTAFAKAFILSVIIFGTIALTQFVLTLDAILPELGKSSANIAVCLLLCCGWIIWQAKGTTRLLAILAALILLMVTSQFAGWLHQPNPSKSALLGFGFSAALWPVILMVWWLKPGTRSVVLAAGMVMIVVVLIGVPVLRLDPIEAWPAFIRYEEVRSLIPVIDMHREAIWTKIVSLLGQTPFFGIGASQLRFIDPEEGFFASYVPQTVIESVSYDRWIFVEFIPTHPHHLMLEMLVELGWPGLLAGLLIIILFLRQGTRLPRDLALVYFPVFACIMGCWLFSFSLWSSWWHVFILSLFICIQKGFTRLYQASLYQASLHQASPGEIPKS